jgi:hypothetical protein
MSQLRREILETPALPLPANTGGNPDDGVYGKLKRPHLFTPIDVKRFLWSWHGNPPAIQKKINTP